MYSRMSSGPSWSVERWKYCANYTPMSSEHGCERLSHDQPIVFSRPWTIGLTSRGTSWQNAEQCAQRSAVADSLAQVAARFRKVKPNRERGQRNRTQTGMI
jgi:trehalose-6-phosphatase